ncbi:MAG: alpha/beta hydrolase [Rhodanobacter sp.]
MKLWIIVLCLLAACASAHAKSETWQPDVGLTQIPLWPGTPPYAQPTPGPEYAKTGKEPNARKTVIAVSNVSRPTMTVYAPKGKNTGAAAVVFPGGGFENLAITGEGTRVCDWLTSRGITCVLLKYRVPSKPYDWHCDCRPHNLELSMPSLQDAQRTLRLVRSRAAEWHIDPHKVGVIGFSAGGFLVAEVSSTFNRRLYAPVDAADRESSRPDFAMAIYPGHLTADGTTFNRNVTVTHETPPTFLVQAEDDYVDGVEQALVYFTALKKAAVPVEMHLYAKGGHGFGIRPTSNPISHWPALAETWMSTIGMIPAAGK